MPQTVKPKSCLLLTLFFLSLGQIQFLNAEKFYVVPLGEIGFEEENISELSASVARAPWRLDWAISYTRIRFDAPDAEAYIALPESEDDDDRQWSSASQRNLQVAIKLSDAEAVSGTVSLASSWDVWSAYRFNSGPSESSAGTRSLGAAYQFKFDPSELEEVTEADFHKIRKSYYVRLASTRIPGGNWFRYQAGDAYKADDRARRWRNLGQFDSSFNMFTGQRAVSENLALEREIILGTSKEGKAIQVDTIKGVTVEPIDWSERITDAPTAIDPLAMVIPHDQHAAFFGSIKALNQVIRVAEEELTHFQMMSNRKAYSGLAKKYQKQMGILIPDMLAEQLPVKSVAITGGDPFLPSGSDLCILFETGRPKALFATLHAMVKVQAEVNGKTHSIESTIGGSKIYAYANDDRSFSSTLTHGENYVAVSNSMTQLQNIQSVSNGSAPSLGSLEEFKFFRQRYPLEEEATAFVFLSDATIRRWAGPEFRIGASRRVRAAAALGQATAQQIDGVELSTDYKELVGELNLHEGKTARSEHFNTLDFLTPIGDLKIETVTPAEKEGYERWRRGYENGWTRFDPIALSLNITDDSIGLDLSVIPLRLNSDYDDWIETAGEATLDQQAMTPHAESIFMFSHAIDTSIESVQMNVDTVMSYIMDSRIGANPIAWIGGSLSIFADQDPFWNAMHEAEEINEYMQENVSRLPMGLRVSSKSPIKLALFLTTLRSFSEQASPGLLVWETRKFEGTPYVVIRTTDQAEAPDDMEINIHYAAMPDALILSLSEDLLKRAITRNLEFAAPKAEESDGQESLYQIFVQTKITALDIYQNIFESEIDRRRRRAATSWGALPILNEWKKAFPGKDPVQAHYDYFKETIHCPGGKGYQWNKALSSMESVTFGHPEAPRETLMRFPMWQNWDQAKAAISIKNKEFRLDAALSKQ